MKRGNLVVVHGFGEHSGRYLNLVSHFVPKGFWIWAYDLRGHGRSPGKRGHINTWEEIREDLRCFLNFVRKEGGDFPTFLFGHSLGGLIVLEYALHYREGIKGVIASSPALSKVNFSPILQSLSKVLAFILPGLPFPIALNPDHLSRDKAVVEAYRKDPFVHHLATPRFGEEMERARSWTIGHAEEWGLPLLLIIGTCDMLVPPEGSRLFFNLAKFPQKWMMECEGGFHEPHNDSDFPRVLMGMETWMESIL
ncbi:MAG: lysophospholipase [Caldiserica bacterium]|jgi:alpha-beta hydrolase superfamily lysophospholipase|nr:lysophospholipase [Caldisericota bacterium]MDH7562008.1 alpha/beta hydrolase [Caldisericota bacterium]